MKLNRLTSVVAPCVAALLSGLLSSSAQAQEKINYQDHILPIFKNACNNCHDAEKKKAGLDLSSFTATLAGSDNGPMVNAGDASGSMLYKVITHAAEPTMPPKRDKLPQAELDMVRKWIEQGMLPTKDGKAAAPTKPKVDLSTVASVGKPSGPSAIPVGLSAEPLFRTARPGAVESLAASPWAPVLAVGGQKQIILYHAQSLEILGIVPFDEGVPNVLQFSRNGNVLLAAGGVGAKLGKVVLYDVATGKRLTDVGDESDEVLAADVSPDQKIVVLGGPKRLIKGYNVGDGSEAYSIKKHTDWVTAIAISPNGEYLATGDRAGNLYVWEAKTGGELYNLTGHKDSIDALVFRDDSNVLLSGSKDATLKLWNMTDGTSLKSANAHTGGVTAANFAHDGRIVSAGRDKAVKIWDPAIASSKTMTPPFNDIALHAAFDSEGQRVFAGDWTGVVRAWNVSDGAAVGEVSPNPPRIADRLEVAMKKLTEVEAPIAKAEGELKAIQDAAAKAVDEHKQVLAAVEKAKADLTAAEKQLANADKQTAEKISKADKPVQEILAKRSEVETRLQAVASAEQAVRESIEAAKKAGGDTQALEADLATKKASLAEGTQQLKDAEAALVKNAKDEALKTAAGEAKARVARRTARVDEAKAALAAATKKAKAAKPDPAALKKVEEAKGDLEKAKQELAKIEANAKLRAEAEQLTADRKKAADALAQAKAAAAAAEGQVQPKADALKGANDKIEAAQKAVAAAKAAAMSARFDVAKLKAQQGATTLQEAQKLLAGREAEKAAAEQAAKDAAALVEKSKGDITAFEKGKAEAPAKIQALTAKIPELRKKATDTAAPAESAGKELAQIEATALEAAELARKINTQAQASKENKNLLDAEASGKKLIEFLAAEINVAKEKVNRWSEAKKKADAELAAAEKELAQIKADVANAETIMAGLKKALAAAEAEVPKKQAAAQAAAKPIEEAKAKVEQARGDYDRLTQEATRMDPTKQG